MREGNDPRSARLPNPVSAAGIGSSIGKDFEAPDWTPLKRLIGDQYCAFMWMWREFGIEFKCEAPHFRLNVKLPEMWSWRAEVA